MLFRSGPADPMAALQAALSASHDLQGPADTAAPRADKVEPAPEPVAPALTPVAAAPSPEADGQDQSPGEPVWQEVVPEKIPVCACVVEQKAIDWHGAEPSQ